MVRIFSKHWRRFSVTLAVLGWLAACRAPALPTRPVFFSPTVAITLTPTPTALQPDGWAEVFPGGWWREARVRLTDGFEDRLSIFRIDPVLNEFRVLYAPAQPAFISAWDSTARLVFNAGFFDDGNAALGLLISQGQTFGQSYTGFGGMFQVSGDGAVRVRSLVAEPYQPGEALEQAVQGFPMLVRPDGTLYAGTGDARARRTVVGQDTLGNIVLVVAPHETFTLAELAIWLVSDPDLKLAVALNLDGGGSTGYYAGPNNITPSYVRLPAVVAVYGR